MITINLSRITGQESGIVVYDGRDAIICNWGNVGAGLPRLFADMFLVAWPANGEIVECGETEDFSEFGADSWCLIYDVNDDAASMAQTSNHWKWWKISLEDEDCDVLVIAPNEWE